MEDSRIVELYWQKNAEAIKETDSKYGAYCFVIADNILHNKEDSSVSSFTPSTSVSGKEMDSGGWLRSMVKLNSHTPSLRVGLAWRHRYTVPCRKSTRNNRLYGSGNKGFESGVDNRPSRFISL